jgi:4-hydroxy-3-polyprenylbenzoate decarboxylase
MSYYRNLHEYVQALERAGLLFRVKRFINKDTEMHPLVRWQFRGLAEAQRRAFLFEEVCDAKGKKYDIPVLIGGLAASQKITVDDLFVFCLVRGILREAGESPNL